MGMKRIKTAEAEASQYEERILLRTILPSGVLNAPFDALLRTIQGNL